MHDLGGERGHTEDIITKQKIFGIGLCRLISGVSLQALSCNLLVDFQNNASVDIILICFFLPIKVQYFFFFNLNMKHI